MRLPPGAPLSVSLAFDHGAPRLPTARLAMDAGVAQLEWSRQIIERRLTVAPLYYQPERGLHAARGRMFDGLHGFLSDSLPDSWGFLLMRRRLAKLGVDIATLSPLDRLLLVGDQGRGALVFEPASTPPEHIETLDLDELSNDATRLLVGEAARFDDTLAALAGGSGGARPKVNVSFDARGNIAFDEDSPAPGFEPWLVKFRAPGDPEDIGPIEEAYALMATKAGLVMAEHRLIPATVGPGYFATRRFDRPGGGARLHMVSLAGAIEAPSDRPSTSYDTFFRATRAITRSAADVMMAFRRMVFNVLARNRDDHTRQHAYLMDANGDWRLAPAYDLSYSAGPCGEHYLDISGEGRRPTRAHVVDLGGRHRLDAGRVAAIVEESRAAVADWPVFARLAGVTPASIRTIADALDKTWLEFGS